MSIEFHGNNSNVHSSRSYDRLENLSLQEKGGWGNGFVGDLKAFVNFVSPNNSRSASFSIVAWFLVTDGAIHPNSLQVSTRFTYSNGTTYKAIVLPTVFTVISDAGGSFDSARLIDFGDYTGFSHVVLDPEDYFKIWLNADQTVKITLALPEPTDTYMNLYFYDPNRNLVSNSTTRGASTNAAQIEYDVLQSGYWYIRAMEPWSGYDLYVLSVEKVG